MLSPYGLEVYLTIRDSRFLTGLSDRFGMTRFVRE